MLPNPRNLLAQLDQAAKEAGFTREEITSAIPAYVRPDDGPVVLLSAGIHGDEPASPRAALAFLKENPPPGFHWLLTPLLNSTGLALGTRENKDGVDLNRDYHLPKSTEIRAHCQWLERQPVPHVSISLHEDYEGTGFYLYEIQTAGRASVHGAIFEKVRPLLPIEPGPIIDGRESTGDGWFFIEELPDMAQFEEKEGGLPEALHLSTRGCPLSLTFETPTHAASLETRVAAHLAAIRAVIDEISSF